MKTLNRYIIEGLKIGSKTKVKNNIYSCKPKDRYELKNIIEKRLKKDKDANLNDIDVSDVTDMFNLFYKLDPHNIDISEWDVSNVINMSCMFDGCKNFNCDISNWDVSKVQDMYSMFFNCKEFNSDLSRWDVSNVINMTYMFNQCISLKNKPSWYKR